jgi:hypothetical protein
MRTDLARVILAAASGRWLESLVVTDVAALDDQLIPWRYS